MSAERRAVLLLLSLALAGQGLRIWVGRPEPGRKPWRAQWLISLE